MMRVDTAWTRQGPIVAPVGGKPVHTGGHSAHFQEQEDRNERELSY